MRESSRGVSPVMAFVAGAVLCTAPWAGALAATVGIGTATVDGKPTSVLTGPGGKTLYYLSSDRPGHQACVGGCLKHWPPLMVGQSLPGAPDGASGHFGRTDAGQLTYQGHPLYTFVRDAGPGQATGEGIHALGGTWWVATPKLPGTGAAPAKSSGSW